MARDRIAPLAGMLADERAPAELHLFATPVAPRAPHHFRSMILRRSTCTS